MRIEFATVFVVARFSRARKPVVRFLRRYTGRTLSANRMRRTNSNRGGARNLALMKVKASVGPLLRFARPLSGLLGMHRSTLLARRDAPMRICRREPRAAIGVKDVG